MTKTTAHCIKTLAKAGKNTAMVKVTLLANAGKDGSQAGGVFLDNAYGDVSAHIDRAEWRNQLAILARQGFYSASQDPEYKGLYGYIHADKE